MREFWSICQAVFVAVGGWLGWFFGYINNTWLAS